MKTDQIQLLRRLALNDQQAMDQVMSGDVSELSALGPRTSALIRIAALLSVNSDPATFHWAAELGVAAGVDDDELVETMMVVAPIIGIARLTSSLPHLMSALGIDVVD